tara:strand:- start:2028 stop:3143 length:1116 start_codon:yes stop_codon:yes gene_type:complete
MSISKVKISNITENKNYLYFTLENCPLCYANGIRRIILSEIPCIVFKYDSDNINIIDNKSRLNNEVLKQRISSIPIHISDIDNFSYKDYIIELEKTNDTNNIIYVTTGDLKIKNKKSNTYINDAEVKKIFPPNELTNDFIDILRLRPKLSSNMDTEKLKFTAELEICNANTDSMYNVVSTCSYGNTKDIVNINSEWDKKEKELKTKNISKEEMNIIKNDWLLIDAKRIFIKDSYDFVIETIGIYENYRIIELASNIIIRKIVKFIEDVKLDHSLIKEASDTLENCYIILLKNEDHTLGKIIEHALFTKYFQERKELNYIGFLKKHPHDKDSYIKISFKSIMSKDDIILILEDSLNDSIVLLKSISDYFSEK